MADSASRALTEPHSSRWTNFSSCWSQDLVPMGCRKLYTSSRNTSVPFIGLALSTTVFQHMVTVDTTMFLDSISRVTTRRSTKTLLSTRAFRNVLLENWVDSGTSASTVQSKLSHISWHHRRTFGYNVGLMPGHQLAITGMRRSDPPNNPKFPVTSEILKCLHNSLNFKRTQHRVLWGGLRCWVSSFYSEDQSIMPYTI
ncbi:Hypothetical protein PHPALM_19635 [Phytophthora palmivora]|uniref:Uncharacterized protein n=1 Tax=Phytophthora palmivora TaxID=4796 RepID=A0A2P4XGY0_9STRA|nr:Hypothetical protein PHPALM_19635 [Phytophthora palmivora]